MQGVGGKVGLAILGAVPVEDLARVVTLEDKAMIARAPGVGPRLAARIATGDRLCYPLSIPFRYDWSIRK